MNDFQVQAISEIEPYQGPHAIPGIRFRPAREALGVSAWGMSVLELDPQCSAYPEHDHTTDGQEEVYVVLRGEATLLVGDTEITVSQGDMVRVGAKLRRKFVTTDQGVVLLALGGTPEQGYSPSTGA